MLSFYDFYAYGNFGSEIKGYLRALPDKEKTNGEKKNQCFFVFPSYKGIEFSL